MTIIQRHSLILFHFVILLVFGGDDMIKTPVCGTCSGTAGEIVTIFVGSDTCFGTVVFTNRGTGNVAVILNGLTANPIATIPAGCKLAIALDSISELAIDYTDDSIVSYKGCICCNDVQCCQLGCDVI